jgi:hypothetical protein
MTHNAGYNHIITIAQHTYPKILAKPKTYKMKHPQHAHHKPPTLETKNKTKNNNLNEKNHISTDSNNNPHTNHQNNNLS